jgi:hypothetical protein
MDLANMPKRSSVRLTKRVVDAAEPGALIFDAEVVGFALRATPAGSKSFIIQYRTRAGRSRKMVLGA